MIRHSSFGSKWHTEGSGGLNMVQNITKVEHGQKMREVMQPMYTRSEPPHLEVQDHNHTERMKAQHKCQQRLSWKQTATLLSTTVRYEVRMAIGERHDLNRTEQCFCPKQLGTVGWKTFAVRRSSLQSKIFAAFLIFRSPFLFNRA